MKINRPILIIRDTFKKINLNVENTALPKRTLRRFVHYVSQINDSRLAGLTTYPLTDILTIAFLAVLAGASDWEDISTFASEKRRFLKKIIPFYQGKQTPSHDTFRRVFGLVAPEEFAKAVTDFLLENLYSIKKALGVKDEGYRLINVDGKEANSTGRKYSTDQKIRNLQTLHVYDASNAVVLYSAAIDEKTNEIPTAQDILKTMDLKDCIVTFDAMNTQKETIRVITGQNGDYVGGLKGNQRLFHEEVALYFTDEVLADIRKKGKNYCVVTEKAHNRIEKRSYYLTTKVEWFADLSLWCKLKAFVCNEIETEDLITGEKTSECRYYIASLTDIEVVADAIRGHWSVENQLHWHLDVSFDEDDNATMDRKAFHNLSTLNKIALTMYKLMQSINKKQSIKRMRKLFGWSLEEELKVLLSMFDENVIREAMMQVKTK